MRFHFCLNHCVCYATVSILVVFVENIENTCVFQNVGRIVKFSSKRDHPKRDHPKRDHPKRDRPKRDF